MRSQTGWVKLYRRALENDIGSNAYLFTIFSTLLCWANYEDSPTTINWMGKPRKIERGFVLTSATEIAARWNVNRNTVSRWLNYLVLRNTISIEKSTSGLIIEIKNYEIYQGQDAEWSQPHKQRDGNHISNDISNEVTHSKEVKNIRIKEIKNSNSICTELQKSNSMPVDVLTETELVKLIPEQTKQRWSKLYEQDFINREVVKAFGWYQDNQRKKPKTIKGWSMALSSWLERGWKYHVKMIPGQQSSSVDKWLDDRRKQVGAQ